MTAFLAALEQLPTGYSEGLYRGTRWGVTLSASSDERRRWLWGEELGGVGRVSFNLFMLGSGPMLRPCEMSAEDVIAFVLGYQPEEAPQTAPL